METLQRTENAGLTINPDKMHIFHQYLKDLGHVISPEQCEPDGRKSVGGAILLKTRDAKCGKKRENSVKN